MEKKKSILDSTFEKHRKLVLEHLNTKKKLIKEGMDVEFYTTVTIDPKKMGKNFPVQEDVEVEVYAEGSYEDSSFDYEYGSIRGRHDPGSGYVPEEVKITAPADIHVYDENGNDTGELLFKAGEEIKEEYIVSMDPINDEIAEKLAARAADARADSEISRYEDRYDE